MVSIDRREAGRTSIAVNPSFAARAPVLTGSSGAMGLGQASTSTASYAGGTVIYWPGEASGRLFWIRRGSVRLLRGKAESRLVLHELLDAGDVFGEIPLSDAE